MQRAVPLPIHHRAAEAIKKKVQLVCVCVCIPEMWEVRISTLAIYTL